MKKLVVAMFAVCLFFVVGCQKQQKTAELPAKPVVVEPKPEAMCIPEWEVSPPSNRDGFYASGQAKLKLAALTRETADTRAVKAMGRQIENKTSSMLKDFMQQSGSDEDASVLEFVQSVSKTISSQTVKNVRVVKRHFCPDGTVFSLAYYPVESYKKEVKKEVAKEPSKTDAKLASIKHNLYDEFKSKKALEDLDEEIDKLLE